jgi:hypothetical protein
MIRVQYVVQETRDSVVERRTLHRLEELPPILYDYSCVA